MNITTGTKISGFTVQRVREVTELNGNLIEMIHDQSGAQLCWMDNKEVNKLFSVAFQTLPQDSTGVFHILEHSVLCGSKKYPVKEPFVDLLKSSMNTFLNAMTYPDKTLYPVSSRNHHDFLNLTSVYLDAVFAPQLLHNPNIFYQEGHHMEMENGQPIYKGVVFNEMKGAMSGVDDRIEHAMNELLFPDNCYRFNSGGDPKVILNLTYEQFVDTYQRFYHPSNARFFLDGDIELEETLALINSYLKRYEKCDVPFHIDEQRPAAHEGNGYYEIAAQEDFDHRAMLAMGKIIGTWKDRTRLLAVQVLCDMLADTNESLLKRALLSSHLGEDLEMGVIDGIAQPYLLLIVRNINNENSDAIRKLIHDTISEAVDKGLDSQALLASVNHLAFRFRQMSEPQGLERATSALKSWLYGGDPLMYMVYDEAMTKLRDMIENHEFEDLLRELLLEDEGMSVLHMLPSKTLGQAERDEEEKRLNQTIASLREEEMAELIAKNKALMDWQQTPDTPAQIATLPTLSLKEVNDTPELIATKEAIIDGVTVLVHPLPTHGIVHLAMYFPLSQFSLEELTQLSLLPSFFGDLPTEHYTVAQLQQAIKTYIGRLHFGLETFAQEDHPECATPYLSVHASVLKENMVKAEELLKEVLLHTRLDERERIREMVMQTAEEVRQIAIHNGHALGVTCALAHYSAQAAVNEAIGGYTFMMFVQRLARHFDDAQESFVALLQRALDSAITKAGLVVSVTSGEDVSLTSLLAQLPKGSDVPTAAHYQSTLPQRMGIRIPAQIAFAVKGYHLSRCDRKNEGSLRVAANILSLSYLWNSVRVQGGAYGAGVSVGRNGGLFMYSYRDPSPARSLSVYDQSSMFLQEFHEQEEDLEKYIISTVASGEPLQTPEEKGLSADAFWFARIRDEDRIQIRKEMLMCDFSKLQSWWSVLDQMATDGAVCVVGPDDALAECEGLTICDLSVKEA